MPDKDVTTTKDLARRASMLCRVPVSNYPAHARPTIPHGWPDGTAAKANQYGFIKQAFRELQNKLFTKG
jgi:hypothetical protein